MGSESYHEPYELIPAEIRDLHRAIISLMEELEAIDWYSQRASVCDDRELAEVLLHNRDEEVEHAFMVLEWIRRRDPVFDRNARRYLFSDLPITEIEERAEQKGGERDQQLGIGSLRAREGSR